MPSALLLLDKFEGIDDFIMSLRNDKSVKECYRIMASVKHHSGDGTKLYDKEIVARVSAPTHIELQEAIDNILSYEGVKHPQVLYER